MKYFNLLIILCLSFQIIHAQKNLPNANDRNIAKSLKKQFKENSIVALNSKDVYRYELDNRSSSVKINELTSEELICLEDEYHYPQHKFYDDYSEITTIKVKYKNGKKKSVAPKHELYNQEGIFHSDARVCYFPLSFQGQGARYKVEMGKLYKNVKYFTQVYLTRQYPIQEREIRLTIPKWMNVEPKAMNFEGYDIEQKEEIDRATGDRTLIYKAKNLPPMKSERRSPGPSHVYPHILLLNKSYTVNNKKVTVFDSTADLYKWYYSLVKQVNNDKTVTKALVERLIKDATTDEEKIKAIYYWVQDNIRYIAFEDGIAGFRPAASQEVYKKKYGDCKGMANLTKNLLKTAGFDARLTWIGTRRLCYDYSTPSLAVDNHMICTVILDGKKYFLDATEEVIAFGENSERIQGREAMIEDGDNYILAKVPIADNDLNQSHIHKTLTLEGETLKGKAIFTYQGESKSRLLYHINNIESDKLDKAIQRYLNENNTNFKIQDLKTSDLKQRDKTLSLEFDLTMANMVSSFGDDIYIDLDFYKEFKQFTFDSTRIHDYLFSHKIKRMTTITLELPAGYQVSTQPKNLEKKHKDFNFNVQYKVENGQLIYTKTLSIDHAIIHKADFDTWNNYIKALAEVYNEQIVLTKKS